MRHSAHKERTPASVASELRRSLEKSLEVYDVCGRRGVSQQPSTRGQSSEAPGAIGKAGREPIAPLRHIVEGRSDPQRDLWGHTDM